MQNPNSVVDSRPFLTEILLYRNSYIHIEYEFVVSDWTANKANFLHQRQQAFRHSLYFAQWLAEPCSTPLEGLLTNVAPHYITAIRFLRLASNLGVGPDVAEEIEQILALHRKQRKGEVLDPQDLERSYNSLLLRFYQVSISKGKQFRSKSPNVHRHDNEETWSSWAGDKVSINPTSKVINFAMEASVLYPLLYLASLAEHLCDWNQRLYNDEINNISRFRGVINVKLS